VSGGAAASTAALQVPVFALALQVFVVGIHRTQRALVAVKVLIWLFCFSAGRGSGLVFWRPSLSLTRKLSWWRNCR
jgi:hypothetical protein